MQQQDDLNVPLIAAVGGISIILTMAVIYAVQALYFNHLNYERQRKVVQAPTADSDSRLAEQEAKLARYSWLDRESGKVTIPVERAMTLVVAELANASAQENDGRVNQQEGKF